MVGCTAFAVTAESLKVFPAYNVAARRVVPPTVAAACVQSITMDE